MTDKFINTIDVDRLGGDIKDFMIQTKLVDDRRAERMAAAISSKFKDGRIEVYYATEAGVIQRGFTVTIPPRYGLLPILGKNEGKWECRLLYIPDGWEDFYSKHIDELVPLASESERFIIAACREFEETSHNVIRHGRMKDYLHAFAVALSVLKNMKSINDVYNEDISNGICPLFLLVASKSVAGPMVINAISNRELDAQGEA